MNLFVCVTIHPLLTSNPTDNIIPTTGQVEEVADHTKNTIMRLTRVSSAIGRVYTKNQMDNKKNPNVRDADQDLSGYISLANKVWEHFFRFPDKKISEIMALSAYIDQPLSKVILGEAPSKESMEWKEFINTKYYTNPA